MPSPAGVQFIRSVRPSALLCSALVAVCVSLSSAPAADVDAGATALQQAQRRMTTADDALNRAKERAAKADKRAKDAAREAEEAKTRLERARSEQEGASKAVTEAQGEYDQARAAVEQIYKARQGASQ